jgi:hypothetical protein
MKTMTEKPNKVLTTDERIAAMEKAIAALTEAHDAQAPFTASNRTERMSKVLMEYNAKIEAEDEAKLKAYDEARAKAFDAKLAVMKATDDANDEEVLRRYLGINKDETLKMSDLPKMMTAMRKAMLESSEPQGKTPASMEKAGPDGNIKPDPFDTAVNKKLGVA